MPRRWRICAGRSTPKACAIRRASRFRASEDFGRFGSAGKSAMFFLGAGEKHPSLHNPDYDFPDDLIPIGAKIFMRAARDLLG